MKKIKIKILIEKDIGIRLDKFLIEHLKELNIDDMSRTRLQNIIGENNLWKDNILFKELSYKTKLNDLIELDIPDAVETKIKATDIKLNIVYEDEYLIVVNKQAGLTTHPGAGNYDNTLVNALLHHCKNNLSGVGGVLRPGIVHRLDKDTSGLMLVAKNDLAHISLSEQIQNREVKRVYNALIWGMMMPKEGSIEGYIDRARNNRLKMELNQAERGKYSLTNYTTLKTYAGAVSLMECRLDTGRTHQIRVHFSDRKHPLIGDKIYGGHSRLLKSDFFNNPEISQHINTFARQALHSKSIEFIHPKTLETMSFEADFPEDFKNLLALLDSTKK